MCATCGVTEEQYDAARRVAHRCCMASVIERQGGEPSQYDWERPSAGISSGAGGMVSRYHAAHPGGPGLTRDELVAVFATRGR